MAAADAPAEHVAIELVSSSSSGGNGAADGDAAEVVELPEATSVPAGAAAQARLASLQLLQWRPLPGWRMRGGRCAGRATLPAVPAVAEGNGAGKADEADACPICLEEWAVGTRHSPCVLSCGHVFGQSCLRKWLKQNKRCPSCNRR